MKALIEKRNALVEKQEEMLSLATTEVRSFTKVEKGEFEGLADEIRGLDEIINTTRERRSKEGVKHSEFRGAEQASMDERSEEVRSLEGYLRGGEYRTIMASTEGHTVPTIVMPNVVKLFEDVAPLWQKVRKVSSNSGVLRVPIQKAFSKNTFITQDGTSVEVSDPQTTFVDLIAVRLGSKTVVTQEIIDDSGVDIVSWVSDSLYRAMGYDLNRAVITGSPTYNLPPTNKIAGAMNPYNQTYDGTGDLYGSATKFEGLNSLVTNAKYASSVLAPTTAGVLTIEDLRKMPLSMLDVYSSGGVWVMNRAHLALIGTMEDAVGYTYVKNEIMNGVTVHTLLGYRIYVNDACEDIYFTNIEETLIGLEKAGQRISTIANDTRNREDGTVTFVTDMRIDMKIARPEATRVITGASIAPVQP